MSQIIDTKQGLKFYGNYLGIVKKHLPMGRCKIWCPAVHHINYLMEPDKLPDAMQASPIFCGGDTMGNGVFSYPSIGAKVWVFFENGDQNLPVYWATSQGGELSSQQYTELAKNGPLDTLPALIHKINCGHNYITIHDSGTIIIESYNPKTEDNDLSTSKIIMKSDGVINIISTNRLVIEAPTVELNAKELFAITAGQMSVNGGKINLAANSVTTTAEGIAMRTSNPAGISQGQ